MLDHVLANIFMFSEDGLGMKDMLVKSGGDFNLERTMSVLAGFLRIQN